jgi:hypothetical protein
MVYYRMYWLDQDNHIASHKELDAASDAECLAHAQTLLNPGETAEVWQRARYVGLINGDVHVPVVSQGIDSHA